MSDAAILSDQSKAESRNGLVVFVLGCMLLFGLFVGTRFIINTTGHVNETSPGFLLNLRMVVTNEGQPSWTGLQAGLKYPDKILAIDGVPVASLDEFESRIRGRTPGEPVTYKVLRGDQERNVQVSTMKFTWVDYIAVYGIKLLIGLFYTVIGFVVFIMKYNTKVAWIFLGTTYAISISYICIYYADLLSMRINYLAYTFELAGAMHFGMNFPRTGKLVTRLPWIQIIPYVIATAIAVPIVYLYPDDRFLHFLQLRFIFEIAALGVVVYAILRDYIKPRNALDKQRARVLLWGALIAFPFPITALASQIIFGSFFGARIDMVWFSLPIMVFPLAVGYAIVKHNLFDVDVYIKRAVGYVIMTVIVAAAYFVIQTTVTTVILQPLMGGYAERLYPIIFALLVVFLFNPINVRVQNFVDRLFFRSDIDYKAIVQSVGNSMASMLDLDAITQRLLGTMCDDMFIDSSGIVMLDRKIGQCTPFFMGEDMGAGEKFPNFNENPSISFSNPLVGLMDKHKQLVTRYDIEEKTTYRGFRDEFLEGFDAFDATMAIPMITQDEVSAIMFLGSKKSGKFYTREDIDLLQTLASQGAVALENARKAQQLKAEAQARTNLARYLSPQIVDRVVSDNLELNLGGQRKEVSIMFSDIRGFTTISETWPPDQLVTILNEYMTEMVEVIFDTRGSVDKYIGDAIVAVYGSLIEVDNHAQAAVKGALGMLKRLPELNKKWQQEYGVGLAIGAGINSGEVFLGNIGSPERMEFTVIGDAVNLASRLEGLTKYYGVGIVVGEMTHARLEGILCRKLDLVRVKGKNESVAIYEPVCELADASDKLKGEIEQYDAALSAYYAREWDRSESIFRDMQQQYPDKKFYQIYLDRLPELRNMDLGADWDGSFTHTSK